MMDPANRLGDPHQEISTHPGFTGQWATERAAKLGYINNGIGVEEIGEGQDSLYNLNYNSGDPVIPVVVQTAIRGDMGVPYHMMGAFSPAIEFGMGSQLDVNVSNNIQTAYGWTFFVMGFGNSRQGQLPPSGGTFRTYPCDGTTDAVPAMFGEWTGGAPVVSRDLGNNPTGTPILVAGEPGKSFAFVSAVITQLSDGKNIPIYDMRTKSHDPNPQLYWYDWMGYILPDVGLQENASYKVDLTVNIGGTLQSKSFTFKTGLRDL
jgi:hypothetical protein